MGPSPVSLMSKLSSFISALSVSHRSSVVAATAAVFSVFSSLLFSPPSSPAPPTPLLLSFELPSAGPSGSFPSGACSATCVTPPPDPPPFSAAAAAAAAARALHSFLCSFHPARRHSLLQKCAVRHREHIFFAPGLPHPAHVGPSITCVVAPRVLPRLAPFAATSDSRI